MVKKQPAKKACSGNAYSQQKRPATLGRDKAASSSTEAASSTTRTASAAAAIGRGKDSNGGSGGGSSSGHSVGLPDQRRILAIFAEAFAVELSSTSFAGTLQAIKQALFERDFGGAFADEASLRVYAARYSPTRALCYAEVLAGIAGHLDGLAAHNGRSISDAAGDPAAHGPSVLRALAIGGGAAEAVAFAAFLRNRPHWSGSLLLLDSGPWKAVVESLTAGLTAPPPLSKYASAEARASNCAFIESSRMDTTFVQADALALGRDGFSGLLRFPSPYLITMLFTLNELFTAGAIRKTTAFLLDLTASTPSGSVLLVVDSPGSYSETVVGKESKKYPMHWLLEKVLSSAEDCTWAKIESHDSMWFRLPDSLKYPIALENMRYQMHLYRLTKHPPST